MTTAGRDLSKFTGEGYNKGRNKCWQIAWALTSRYVIEQVWCPNRLRISILRFFGADIGRRVLIRHNVRIHWPWKLKIGDNSWIGVGAWLLNLEDITIGTNVCISQEVMICTGSHDATSPSFAFDNAPITIEPGVWIATRATVLRGVTVGSRSVVGAAALVVEDVTPDSKVLAPKASKKADGI